MGWRPRTVRGPSPPVRPVRGRPHRLIEPGAPAPLGRAGSTSSTPRSSVGWRGQGAILRQARRLATALGCEVDGVDLRPPLGGDAGAFVHGALIEHQVLFFHDQQLTDEEHLALAAQFGHVSIYPVSRLAGATQPRVSYIRDSADSPPDAAGWH